MITTIQMIADIVTQAVQSQLAKEVVTVAIVPAATAVVWWFVAFGRKMAAVHRAILPNGGTSLIERISRIEDAIVILRDGVRIRARKCGVCPAGDSIYECDETGKTVWVSDSLAEMFGVSPESMLDKGWLYAIDDAAERGQAWMNWNTSVSKGLPYADSYKVRNHRTGERFLVRTSARASLSPDGRVLHFFGEVEKVHPVKLITHEEVAQEV